MAKITRKTFKQFGVSGTASFFGQFGSKQAGIPQTSQDPTVIQQLTAWINGWQNAISGTDKAPYLEDMNGLIFVLSYMIAYLFQEGLPEWDSGTTYFTGSVVQSNASDGQQFRSLQDNNLAQTPPPSASNAFWQWINPPIPYIPSVGNALKANLLVKPNTGAPTTKTDITADLLSVQGIALAAVSLTADITVSGANGLDTGAPANSTWYAIHVITNATGSLTASLYSLSASAPTLPAGYTLFRRVGWARRGTGAFFQFSSIGDWVYWNDATAFTFSPSDGTNSYGTSVPSTSTLFSISIQVSSNSGNTVTWKPTGANAPAFAIARINDPAGSSAPSASSQQLPLSSGQQGDLAGTGVIVGFASLGYYDPV